MPITDKWDRRFLGLAEHIAQWSKDPSTKTGAVIVDSDRRVVSIGFNGFASGVHDGEERYADREQKYRMILHCERNAIIFARQNLTGCILYTWPFMSCATCAAMVIQTGIKEVVAPVNDDPLQRFANTFSWQNEFALARQQFQEAGVTVRLVPG